MGARRFAGFSKSVILAGMGDSEKRLDALKKAIEADDALPLRHEANLVFGEGDPAAKVMFIGEAPGFHENRLMRPFVGQAGQLLDKLLATIHWPRESVYITNIVKRRPPENRDPLPEELAAYAPYLKQQIDIINPRIIATLGRFSMNYFLPDAKISRDHGRTIPLGARLLVPLYHPAAALRATAVLRELEADFKKLPDILTNWHVLTAAPAAEREAKKEVTQTPLQSSLF